MKFSFNTCRFVLVLAAVCNAATAAVLRGNSPTTNAATPFESLADAHSRMLALDEYTGDSPENIAVQSGGGIVFTSPPSTIAKGHVCADSSFTGLAGEDGNLVVGDYILLGVDPETHEAYSAFTGGCRLLDPLLVAAMAKTATAKPMVEGGGEMGGLTYDIPGTHYAASLTVADNTQVTLKGGPDDFFLFLSGSTLVTGANTQFILPDNDGNVFGEDDYDPTKAVQPKNILFALTAAATTGAGSTLEGSILAGAAITLGAESVVTGYVLAKAAMTVGAGCSINQGLVKKDDDPDTANGDDASPIQTVINQALCYTANGFTACPN